MVISTFEFLLFYHESILFSEPKLLQILNRLWNGCLTNQSCRWPLLCSQGCAERTPLNTRLLAGLRVGTLPTDLVPLFLLPGRCDTSV